MFTKKKILSIIMTTVMMLSLFACSKKAEETDAPATVAPTNEVTPTAEPVTEKVAEGLGVTFDDGKYDFIALNTAPGNADESVLSIVDFNGSKALKVDIQAGKIPYVAIDVSSLVGDKITEVRSIEMDITLESPDGNFYACSGKIYAYSGVNRTESKDEWSVYLENKNPNLAKGVLEKEGEYFVAGAKNFFVLTKEVDNGLTAGAEASDFYIDNIVIRDASGNPIAVDTSVGFDKPAGFGADDTSNLTKLVGEASIDGATGSSDGGWAQAVQLQTIKNDGGVFDPAILTPGTIFTVWFSSASAPELVLQSWTDGKPDVAGWAKVAPFAVNDSVTIAQFKYEDMVTAFGTEDFVTYLDVFIVGDTGNALGVTKITYGAPSGGKEVEVAGAAGKSDGAWGQAVSLQTIKNEGGTFDSTLLSPGSIVSVYYSSDIAPELVLQSWTDGKPEAAGWAKVAATADTGSIATYSYDAMVQAFGTEDIATYLDAFNVGDCGAALEVTKVTISSTSAEKEVSGATGKSDGAWGQAVNIQAIKNEGGVFDPALLSKDCIVSVYYNSEICPELILQSWTDGKPEAAGWAKVAASADTGTVATFTYADMVTAFGTDDFATYLDAFNVGDCGAALEVTKVTVQ